MLEIIEKMLKENCWEWEALDDLKYCNLPMPMLVDIWMQADRESLTEDDKRYYDTLREYKRRMEAISGRP